MERQVPDDARLNRRIPAEIESGCIEPGRDGGREDSPRSGIRRSPDSHGVRTDGLSGQRDEAQVPEARPAPVSVVVTVANEGPEAR
jgi:hypothetical protein